MRLNRTVNSYLTLPPCHVSSYPQTTGKTVTPFSWQTFMCEEKGHVKNCSHLQQHFCSLPSPQSMVATGWSHRPYPIPHFNLKGWHPLVQTFLFFVKAKELLFFRDAEPELFASSGLCSLVFNSWSKQPSGHRTDLHGCNQCKDQPSPTWPLHSAALVQGRDGKDGRTYHRHIPLAGKKPHEGLSSSIGRGVVLGCVAVYPGEVWWTAAALPGVMMGAPESQTQGVSLLGKITGSLPYNNQNKTWGAGFFRFLFPPEIS